MSKKRTFKEDLSMIAEGYKILFKIDKRFLFYPTVTALINSLLPFVNLFMSARILTEPTEKRDLQTLVAYAAATVAIILAVIIMNAGVGMWIGKNRTEQTNEAWQDLSNTNRLWSYYSQSIHDFTGAMDIRIFKQAPIILKEQKNWTENAAYMRLNEKIVFKFGSIQTFLDSVVKRIKTLPKGLDTALYKNFEEDGVEISGGEAQKIALARALYKNAPFIVLDEPTAALDPIAEFEVYSKFNEIVGDKTAVYISHRLSSCRFCDDIAVFHEGELIQRGSHDALLADKTGEYYELWNAQAQYYAENDEMTD